MRAFFTVSSFHFNDNHVAMFKSLTDRLAKTLSALRGTGRLSEQNIRDALRDVRMALLEADVALPVVKAFTDAARDRALGTEVTTSLTPVSYTHLTLPTNREV